MATHLLYEFPLDEQEDFATACKARGRSVEEFEVTDEDNYPAGTRVSPIKRQVTVALRGKSTVQIYDGGYGSTWTADFENDLRAGFFD